MRAEPLLEICDLAVEIATPRGTIVPVDGVSLSVAEGETLALVGESGSGKTVIALSILRLLPERVARIARGTIRFRGEDLAGKSERAMQALRGDEIAMIFQDPLAALNPVISVGSQVAEAIRLHRKVSRARAKELALDALRLARIAKPEERARAFPHELSGGLRQRVLIAAALACRPALLIADEPTAALDAPLRSEILGLLKGLQRELGMSMVLISHDLTAVAAMADEIAVIYTGQIVERAPASDLLAAPHHHYTDGLLRARPRPTGAPEPLPEMPGFLPSLHELPSGCRFAPRCNAASARCREEAPPLRSIPPENRDLRCHQPRSPGPDGTETRAPSTTSRPVAKREGESNGAPT